MFNPSNAEATLVQSTEIFENRLNPVVGFHWKALTDYSQPIQMSTHVPRFQAVF